MGMRSRRILAKAALSDYCTKERVRFTKHAAERIRERTGKQIKHLKTFLYNAIRNGKFRIIQHHADGETVWMEVIHDREPIRFVYDRDRGQIVTFLPTVKIGTPVLTPEDLAK